MAERSPWHVKDSFNLIAPIYDLTAQLCFAGSILRAQRSLKALAVVRRALIIGGGSGAQLQGLLRSCPELQIIYLEASSEMISLAQRRLHAEERARVTWLHDTHERLYEAPSLLSGVDLVVTSFFMDVLSPHESRELITFVTQELKRGALGGSERREAAPPMWLLTDFAPHRGWRGLLVRLMYVAFKLLTGLHNQQLIDYSAVAQRQGWRLSQHKDFALGMIYAAQLSLPHSSSDAP